MAELIKGAPVAAIINERSKNKVEALKARGIDPTLAILRVGEREDDLAYERGAMKKAAAVGVSVKNVILPADVPAEEFYSVLESLNTDDGVHGILVFQPLPKHIDGEKARKMLNPAKDVDGSTDGSMAGVYSNSPIGFPPCTAEAAMEILFHYGIDPKGKKAAVIGRSLVIGRPVAMMLMHKNATVTLCHTKTLDVPSITRDADIVICASGQMESVTHEYLMDGQTVIDVGINWSEEKQKICGDVRIEELDYMNLKVTPVPGGVGAVTSSLLIEHVVTAAERQNA